MRRILLRPAESDQEVGVTLERTGEHHSGGYLCHVADRPHEIEITGERQGCSLIQIHGRVVPYLAVRNGSSVSVWVDGRTYSLDIVDRTARRSGATGGPSASNRVTAPMPGRILRVLVQCGDTFDAHQPLIIMESMKMETTLSASHPGRIKRIGCEEGELVDMGANLADIEELNDHETP